MDVNEAQEAKQLRDENTRLKKLVVDLSLDKEMLKAPPTASRPDHLRLRVPALRHATATKWTSQAAKTEFF